ncbi:transcriptional regulator [Kibdelosporangium persicum]|uniref:Transcriptional regulator n=1 Tax=Kibdelosporangium persicum TaxID=2698649 RepID=A0ABX2EXG0_9PSEU|nr:transcriptional regulator [Kibdelosporangium persicum]NRN63678.1 Transcriptional regulator [Kibdelosporangium persicum]
MTTSAREVLADTQAELTPLPGANRLLPLLADGRAPVSVIAALAGEERRIIASDWRAFLTLAARAEDSATRQFFSFLAGGESVALDLLVPLAEASGADMASYTPQAGCQAYPAYVASLALNASPVDALLALFANFAAWGEYCAAISASLRANYGFDDRACGFFDFFAKPVPEPEQYALTAIQSALDSGWQPDEAQRHGRLLLTYELMFWNTLADTAASPSGTQ